jgi:predicted Ser/Thr protein kinase
LAVVELLDDLRKQIVRHYMLQIHAYYQDDRLPDGRPQYVDPEIDGEPF